MARQGEMEFPFQHSWAPATPLRPTLPTAPQIHAEKEVSQINQAKWLGSEGRSPGFTAEAQVNGLTACTAPANCTGVNEGVNHLQADLAQRTGISGGSITCRQFPIDPTAEFSNVPFGDLLALADAASRTCSSLKAAQQRNDSMITGSCISTLDSQSDSNQVQPSSADESIPQQSYDLNLLPGTMANIDSQKFAPITPDKAMRVRRKEALEIESLQVDEKTRKKEGNKLTATAVDSNILQFGRDFQEPATNSSLVSAPTENQNPDKGGSKFIEISGTLQQKPRRKKHRPKVITEGKPRTPKPRTTKRNGSQENPTGKRKYVRKKRIDKSSSTPPAEASGESTTRKRKYVRKKVLNKDSTAPTTKESGGAATAPEALDSNKKSCKRTLNFDMEGPQEVELSTTKSGCSNSESGTPNLWHSGGQVNSTWQLGEGIEVTLENTEAGIADDRPCSKSQIPKHSTPLSEGQAPSTPLPANNKPRRGRRKANSQKQNHVEGNDKVTAHYGQRHNAKIMSQTDTQLSPRSRNNFSCGTSSKLVEGKGRELKRNNSNSTEHPDTSNTNEYGSHFNSLCTYRAMSCMHFPNIHKRKRADKGQTSVTTSVPSLVAAEIFVPQGACSVDTASGGLTTLTEAVRENPQNTQQTFGCIMALNQNERLKKKRSKASTRVQDFTLSSSIMKCTNHPTCSGEAPWDCERMGVGDRPHTSIEALVEEMQSTVAKKKRTKKRNSIINPASCGMSEEQTAQKIVLYSHKQLFSGAPPQVVWKEMSINAISEQFKHLNINREGSYDAYQQQNAIIPYDMRNQDQNALVLYTRDGNIVPYPVKKQQTRPKVDLDEETNRVWKLLLENINSEGIDGTDEDKAKWWEEERRVFHGRAESFIARMHLIQGDRRFSKWKGSVVDSVIGVFLTQNVSDHLSSSAFMSLAARFPLKSKINEQPCHEEGSSSMIDRPEFYVLDPEETLQWNEKPIDPVHDQSFVTLHDSRQFEEKEAVNSNDLSRSTTGITSSIDESKQEIMSNSPRDSELCHDSVANRSDVQIIGGGNECFQYDGATDDAISYQNSMVPSQNSQDSSIVQTTERIGSSSESNSEAVDQIKGAKFNILNSSCSFVKLLEMAGSTMLHEVYVHANYSMSFIENLRAQGNQCQNNQGMDDLGDPKSFTGESIKSEVISAEHSEMYKEETKSSEMSKAKDENSKKQSPLAIESAYQITDQNGTVTGIQVASLSPGEYNQSSNNRQRDKSTITQCQAGLPGGCGNLVESSTLVQNKKMQRQLKNHSGEILDATESTTILDNQRNTQPKIQESNLYDHNCSFNKEHDTMEPATSKPKSRKTVKEKENYDWDSLRKQAEASGKRRERTEKTMDSLDYEAVRCADVHEIAKTIKERGMNNMLAERIKDFLNRLVREHGSIDLEWLRDVPPDKAKEYLLSIRGLGLKSVECVRLLTLHHLAFPVDTNVGRIAVRLGWVPLQPLPESLQLHLLELYPVLESIQKYLWPRLCKLDQRTLYELHYQMITFGKVFCTKSKPNCNACPMRGECRHFASAFASARLALPGPEEKSIISSMKSTVYDQNPAMTIDQPLLPLPQPIEQPEGNQQSEANRQSEGKDGVNKCEPIIEEPASPEPVCIQVSENDIEDIEDTLCDDPDEIPTIKLDMDEFTQTLQSYMQNNMELEGGDMSKALVALTAEAASIPMPKLKNVSRLRTEHQVYELPDSHPLLKGLDKREPDDPCKYLLAIWTPGETANSIQPPEERCSSQEHGKLCDDQTCFSCNSIREAESHIVRGTLLIPCRTAMRGSFPLNGTYFQVNEVFADHGSSLTPIDVPREWLWNLPRRTVYFGTSTPSIFKGLTTEGIQHCFWRGYVCVRGFDQKTRAPRPLIARLHFPASKLNKAKDKDAVNDD